MSADELKFGTDGMEDTGFEVGRKEIPAEVARQQLCGCSYCTSFCAYECRSGCVGTGMGNQFSVEYRLSEYDGEHWGETA